MANREGRSSAVRRYDEPEEPLGLARPRDTSGILTIPTGDRRHISFIREGVIRYDEVFMRDRVQRLPVDPDALVVDKPKPKNRTGLKKPPSDKLDTKAAKQKKAAK